MSNCIYTANSQYDSLTEHEGQHEGFKIEVDVAEGGWLITGDTKAFRKWIAKEGFDGTIE